MLSTILEIVLALVFCLILIPFRHYIDMFWDAGSIVGPGRGFCYWFFSNYLLGITQLGSYSLESTVIGVSLIRKEQNFPDIDILTLHQASDRTSL